MKSQKSNSFTLISVFIFRRYLITFLICTFFLVSYLLLPLYKHQNFLSGYDLSIMDQAVWKYSQFLNPISTTHVYYDAPIYTDHLEIIFLFIAPIYWLIDSANVLIVLQTVSVVASGIAVFMLAKRHGLKNFVANSLLVSYFLFFGIQFAIWSDVHSLVFAIGFISWFLYFLDARRTKLTLFFLLFSIICKEDIGLLTSLISFVYLIKYRDKLSLISLSISVIYLLFVFFVYFPQVANGYKYANPQGLLHDLNPTYFYNTGEKRNAIYYSLGSFGFVPLAAPFFLIPFVGDIGHYFVLGNTIVTSSHGIFAHYRSTAALLLIVPVIFFISGMKKYNNKGVGMYIIFWAFFFQYYLHLPISYLTKSWFWNGTQERENIQSLIEIIPQDASIVTQTNITPHLTHREDIYTLIPYTRDFESNSPCKEKTCRWFRVGGNPQLLLIDVGQSWNILHYLVQRDEFLDAISNLERNGNIKLLQSKESTRLYQIVKKI